MSPLARSLMLLGGLALTTACATEQQAVQPTATGAPATTLPLTSSTVPSTVAPTTASEVQEPFELDASTIDWWESQSAELQDLACSAGFDAVVYSSPDLDEATFDALCSGEVILSAPRAGTALSVDEFDSLLSPAVAAWARTPSPTTYNAIAAGAAALLDSNRPYPAEAPVDERTMSTWLASLATYPGDDLKVVTVLAELKPLLPSAPAIVDDGTYRVGTEIAAGTYRTVVEVEGCYWETTDSTGEVNDNASVFAAPSVVATIRSTDFGFNSRSCGPWIRSR